MYSHAPPCTGTDTTSRRIVEHLREGGHDVVLAKHWDLDRPSAANFFEPGTVDLLIGTHAYLSGSVFAEASLPYILILSGTDVDVDAFDPRRMALMQAAVDSAAAVVCYDDDHLERARTLWPRARSRLVRVPKGVQCVPSGFSVRNLLGLEPEDRVFLLPAGLRAVKDVLFLTDVIDEWRADDERVHLVIVGLAREPAYAEEVLLRCDRSDGLHLLDPLRQTDLHGAMMDSTAVVNTSLSESSPNAVLEAMHLGCVAIVRDIPGNRALVDPGVTGLLFGSAEEFRAQAMSVSNPGLCQRLGREARYWSIINHSMKAERIAYCGLLRSVADG